MKGLTPRQSEVLAFLREFIERNKYPPTIREISHRFSISVKGAHDHVQALERKGVIRCVDNRSRAIEVLHESDDPSHHSIEVPLLGRVAAGLPIFADANFLGTVLVARTMATPGSHFALHVKGDSMIGAGIMDGDIALIRHQNYAENGDIIVAMIDEESYTLKKFYKENSRIKLEPANTSYATIWAQEVVILGKLRGLIRNYA